MRGVTSNPSIFQKAITASTDYDAAIERLVDEGSSVNDIYETLAIQDIRRACDILQPVYQGSDGGDGYVSLEVNPKLAYDTEGTVMEARRLSSMVDRANVMIKVPATPQGIPAIETLIGEGINVNVTLIFSLQQYEDSATGLHSRPGEAGRGARGPQPRGVGGIVFRQPGRWQGRSQIGRRSATANC